MIIHVSNYNDNNGQLLVSEEYTTQFGKINDATLFDSNAVDQDST